MIRTFLALIFLTTISCTSLSRQSTATYIPRDLNDAHRELMEMLSTKEIDRIKAMKSKDEMIDYHMTLGLGLRNQWGLWHDSRLAKYFEQLGIYHADDMSGIILETFWCKLHDQPYGLDERIKEMQDYWRYTKQPQEGSPKDGARIAWVIIKGDGPGTVHLGLSTSDRSYWRYEYGSGRGVEPATEADRKDLDDLMETWKQLDVKIEDMLKER